jgi:hypothetical protein
MLARVVDGSIQETHDASLALSCPTLRGESLPQLAAVKQLLAVGKHSGDWSFWAAAADGSTPSALLVD